MKWFVNTVSALAVSTAAAFDSDAWLRKREDMAREASRLKALYADCAAKATEPAENVAVPIESHPGGAVKSSVVAKKAQFFLESGLIWGEGVVVRELKADGSEFARIDAENCIVDRNARSGWAQGRVKAVYGGTVLEGEGVYLSFAGEFVAITDKAKIVSSEFDVDSRRGEKRGNGDGKGCVTSLSSRRADYDRKEGVIMFDGHVALDALVRGEEYAMRADQMFVFLDGTNDMKRVVALGGVVVTNGFRVGSCEKAVYAKAANRVTMYGGDDGSKARLASEDPKQKGEVEGRKITFWLDSEQVEVEGSTVKLDAGRLEGDGKKGMKGLFGK